MKYLKQALKTLGIIAIFDALIEFDRLASTSLYDPEALELLDDKEYRDKIEQKIKERFK